MTRRLRRELYNRDTQPQAGSNLSQAINLHLCLCPYLMLNSSHLILSKDRSWEADHTDIYFPDLPENFLMMVHYFVQILMNYFPSLANHPQSVLPSMRI